MQSLSAHVDTPTIQTTQVNPLYNEAHPFMSLVHIMISLNTCNFSKIYSNWLSM